MQDLPANLRTSLKSEYVFGTLEIALEQVSKDGTYKRAYRLTDGQIIESVLMPYEDGRRTACISSQAGCAMVSYNILTVNIFSISYFTFLIFQVSFINFTTYKFISTHLQSLSITCNFLSITIYII